MDRVSILITGGRGYIARRLYSALKLKHNITLVTRDDFDLTSWKETTSFLQGKYFDVIIHTAVVGGNRLVEESDKTLTQNLLMYYNLTNNRQCFGKLISFGSGAEMRYPTTFYGLSKRIIAESMLADSSYLNLRVFAVFDEEEDPRRFIKSNLIRYIKGNPMEVYEDKLMDFFYMKDLISLVDYHLQHPNRWLFNSLDCKYVNSHTLLEVAQMINKLENYKVPIHVASSSENSYIGEYVPMPIPLVGLEGGIVETYQKLKTK
jgi:GDP-L-fucose synthase